MLYCQQVMKMKCLNQLCIYQEEDQCLLEEIELDSWGRCKNSIATILIDPSLKIRKKLSREQIENNAAVPYPFKTPPSK